MPSVTGWKASGSENSPEANTAGMASRKPNLADSGRSSPRNRPALMVDPDRDTPGTSARHCAMPTSRPSRQVSCSTWRVCLPKYSAAAMTAENTSIAVATTQRLRTLGADLVLEQQARARRSGCEPMMTYQPEPVVDVVTVRLDEQPVEPGLEDPDDVAAEVDQHGGLGAQLGDRGEGGAGIAGEEHPRHDRQMPRGRDRQELGQTLDDGENDHLQPRHRRHIHAPTVPDEPGVSARRARHGVRRRPRRPARRRSGCARRRRRNRPGCAPRWRRRPRVRHRAGQPRVGRPRRPAGRGARGRRSCDRHRDDRSRWRTSRSMMSSTANSCPVGLWGGGQRHEVTITPTYGDREQTNTAHCLVRGHLESVVDSGRLTSLDLEHVRGLPVANARKQAPVCAAYAGMFAAVVVIATGCSSNPFDARPADHRTRRGRGVAAGDDPLRPARCCHWPAVRRPRCSTRATGSLVVFTPGPDPQTAATLTVFGPIRAAAAGPAARPGHRAGRRRPGHAPTLPPGAATSPSTWPRARRRRVAIDGRRRHRLHRDRAPRRRPAGAGQRRRRGLHAGQRHHRGREGRRSSPGWTPSSPKATYAVVLDRGQTSVTALNSDGKPQQALRAGLKAPPRSPPTRWAGCWSPTPAADSCWSSGWIR